MITDISYHNSSFKSIILNFFGARILIASSLDEKSYYFLRVRAHIKVVRQLIRLNHLHTLQSKLMETLEAFVRSVDHFYVPYALVNRKIALTKGIKSVFLIGFQLSFYFLRITCNQIVFEPRSDFLFDFFELNFVRTIACQNSPMNIPEFPLNFCADDVGSFF